NSFLIPLFAPSQHSITDGPGSPSYEEDPCAHDSMLRERIPGDPHHVAADDLLNVLIRIAPLDQTDRKQRPVCPGDAGGCLGRCLVIVVRPEGTERLVGPRTPRD